MHSVYVSFHNINKGDISKMSKSIGLSYAGVSIQFMKMTFASLCLHLFAFKNGHYIFFSLTICKKKSIQYPPLSMQNAGSSIEVN